MAIGSKIGTIWTPERAIAQIPEHGIQQSHMFLRRSPLADNKAFADVVCTLLPQTPQPDHSDAMSFVTYLGDLAYRVDSTHRIILAVIEATVVIKPKTCITALREGLKLVRPENELLERVIPIVVIDEDRSHTQYDGSSMLNPDGPKEVFEQAKRLGAIVIKVTPHTIRERVSKTLQDILKGVMPVI